MDYGLDVGGGNGCVRSFGIVLDVVHVDVEVDKGVVVAKGFV